MPGDAVMPVAYWRSAETGEWVGSSRIAIEAEKAGKQTSGSDLKSKTGAKLGSAAECVITEFCGRQGGNRRRAVSKFSPAAAKKTPPPDRLN